MKDDDRLQEKAEVVIRRGYGSHVLGAAALALFFAAALVFLWFLPDLHLSLRVSGTLMVLALTAWGFLRLRRQTRLVFAANDEGLYYRPRGSDPTLVLIPWRYIHRIQCQPPSAQGLAQRIAGNGGRQLMEVHFRTPGAPVLPPVPANGWLDTRREQACVFCFTLPRRIQTRPLLQHLLQLNRRNRRRTQLRRIA